MDIKAVILKVLADIGGFPEGLEITEELKLREDLKYDDVELVELILGLEDEVKVEIPDVDAEKFVTVKDVIDYLTIKTTPTPKPTAKDIPAVEPTKPADPVKPEPVKPVEPAKPVEPKKE